MQDALPPLIAGAHRRRKARAFNPALALFANGEAGAWYDPSDLTPEKVSWRRNLLTYSEQFDNSAYIKVRSSITANATVAPDGTTTADKLVEDTTATNSHDLRTGSVAVTSGAAYTISIFAKAAERSAIGIFCGFSSATALTYFNLSNGTIGTVSSNATAAIADAGNGWYRCSLTVTANTTSGTTFFYIATGTTAGTETYTGNGTSGVLLWGAQIEQSPTANSYQRITDFTSDFLAAFPTHALYQDSAGTTPVTALGQPVGLVLDKSKGLGSGALGFGQMGRRNLLLWSEQFDNAVWTKTNASITPNAGTAPDGSATADKLVENTATAVHQAYQNYAAVTVGGPVTFSVFVKAVERTVVTLLEPNGLERTFNLATGVATGSGASMVDVGNGWWRCIASATFIDLAVRSYAVRLNNGTTTNYTGDGTSGVLIWGAQLEAASTVSSYQRVTDTWYNAVPGAHAIQATSASRPTCDARVNLLTYSEQFENAAWTKANVTVSANAAVAPDGTNTADKLVENTSTAVHLVRQDFAVAAGVPYAISMYAKAAERSVLFISPDGGSNTFWFDLANGTTGGTGAGSSTIQSVGNGWYRCVYLRTYPTAISAALLFYVSNSTSVTSYTGDGTSGVLVWGADFRVASDASFPYQRVVTASDYADVQAPRYLTCDGIDDSLYTAASVDFATWTSGTRRNLLTYPSAFDNAVWSQGTGGSVSANTVVAPDGTTTADAYTWATSTPSFARLSQYFAGTPQVAHTFSIWLKRPAGSGSRTLALAITDYTISTASVLVTVTEEWQRFTFTRASPNATGFIGVGLSIAAGSTIAAGDVLHVWGAQLELGSTATAFQDVGTDKMTVVTGVRKLSDAVAGILVETSAAASSNNGAFYISTSPGATAAYGALVRGTSSGSFDMATFAAPITNVVSMLGDISALTLAAQIIPRVNGVVEQDAPAGSVGTGNFGTYVLYIARRNNASNPFNGRLYQLIVRGAATDTATVQQTERFVAGKTGVTL